MNSVTNIKIKNPKDFQENPLEEILREGARKMLQSAIELEVQEYCHSHRDLVDENGHRIIVRNGYLPERHI